MRSPTSWFGEQREEVTWPVFLAALPLALIVALLIGPPLWLFNKFPRLISALESRRFARGIQALLLVVMFMLLFGALFVLIAELPRLLTRR